MPKVFLYPWVTALYKDGTKTYVVSLAAADDMRRLLPAGRRSADPVPCVDWPSLVIPVLRVVRLAPRIFRSSHLLRPFARLLVSTCVPPAPTAQATLLGLWRFYTRNRRRSFVEFSRMYINRRHSIRVWRP